MFAFTVTATAMGLPSLNTSVPSGGGTFTTTICGGGSVTGGAAGGTVVVNGGGTVVVVVGVDGVVGVAGVDGVVVVGVVVVGGVAGGVAVCTATGFEICVARGSAVTGVRDRGRRTAAAAQGARMPRHAVLHGDRLRLRGGHDDLCAARRRRREFAADGIERPHLNQQRRHGNGHGERRRHRDQLAD